MTQVLLCAGPGLLVVKRDGLLFFCRPGQPDAPVPYAPEHYSVFLASARQKHGLVPVVGPSNEEAPCLPDDAPMPALRRDRLASGEEVYRLDASEVPCEEEGRVAKSPRRATPVPGDQGRAGKLIPRSEASEPFIP
jgi:hypothetical protein